MRKVCIFLILSMFLGCLQGYCNDETTKLYTAAYATEQGVDNWFFCEFSLNEVKELTLDKDGIWRGEGEFPTLSNKTMTPSDITDVGFKFVAPERGMVRIKGTVSIPWDGKGNGIMPLIFKDEKELWRSTEAVKYGFPAEHELVTSVKKGEELCFMVNSNGGNGWDWTEWWPTVEYLDIPYEDEDEYLYFQKSDEGIKQLHFDEKDQCYKASDGIAMISDEGVMPTDQYSLVKRYMVSDAGRHRIYGKMGKTAPQSGGLIVSVIKNNETIWEQLFPEEEGGILDVRAMCAVGDIIDIEVKNRKLGGYGYTRWDVGVSKFVGTLPCTAETSSGHFYDVIEEYSISSLVGDTSNDGNRYYTVKNDIEYPMVYNPSTGKWHSSIEGDTSFISAGMAQPGSHTDAVFETIVKKSGILHIDGEMIVNRFSDGVICKIYLNDKEVWSSRTGGERAVRWDEPYDISYFLNKVNVVAQVEEGDKLVFLFDQWRKPNCDMVDFSGVKLRYIDGSALSETTRWKLDKSIVIDTKTSHIYRNGKCLNVNMISENGISYIAGEDVAQILGDNMNIELTARAIDGNEYFPLQDIVESNGRNFIWVADRLAIVYDGIPVLFGWAELSEIETLLKGNGDTSLLLKDNAAKKTFQSDAVVITYPANTGKLTDYMTKFSFTKGTAPIGVYDFDLFIPVPANFAFSSALENSGNQTEREQFLISSKGKIYATYTLDAQSDMSWWFNNYADSTVADNNGKADVPVDFLFDRWHNVKLITTATTEYLYLDNVKIGSLSIFSGKGQGAFEIQNYSMNDAPCYIDNLKIGSMDSFAAPEELNGDEFTEAIYVVDDDYKEKNLDISLEELKPGIDVTGDRNTSRTWSRANVDGAYAKILKQDTAFVVSNTGDAKAETVNLGVTFENPSFVGDDPEHLSVSFEINLFKSADVVFSTVSECGQSGYHVVISKKGYLTYVVGRYPLEWNNFKDIFEKNQYEAEAAGYSTVAFDPNTWHKITFVYERAANGADCYLYCDSKFVGKADLVPWYSFSKMEMDYFTAVQSNEAILSMDNISTGRHEENLYVNEFEIVDYNGNKVMDFVVGQRYYVRFDAESSKKKEQMLNLIVAQYGDGIMKTVEVKEFTLDRENPLQIDHTSLDDALSFVVNEKVETIKLFVWDGLMPLHKALCILKK